MTKIDIGIDARMIHNTGIGTYIQGLLNSFAPCDYQMGLFGGPELQQEYPHCQSFTFEESIYSIREHFTYPFHLKKCRLWHAPHYNVPLIKTPKTKVIVTIHDLIHWIFRKQYFSRLHGFYAWLMLNHASRNSDHVITVSESTKKDLVHYFHADPEKISVIYEGVDFKFTTEINQSAVSHLKLPERYFLYVGSLKPHKNILMLLQTFAKLHQSKKIYSPLVIIGKKDKAYPEITNLIALLQKKGFVVFLESINDSDLVQIYQRATALVHPALYEGFGLTLLEAMACGTAVITSPNASIPEVVGKSACLVDSSSENGMMQAVIRMEKEDVWRNEWTRKGIERAKLFHWDKTAQQTLEVYEKVLSSS